MYKVENKVCLFTPLFVEKILVTNLEEYEGDGVYTPLIWNREIDFTPSSETRDSKYNTGVWNIKWKENNMSERYGIK